MDTPERDDAAWLFHLNLRKAADGTMEFLRREVAPYLVPVEEFAPHGALGEEPLVLAGASAVVFDGSSTPAVAPVLLDDRDERDNGSDGEAGDGADETGGKLSLRIPELLALAEESPSLSAVSPYLDDPDPALRRTAVATLTETTPAGPTRPSAPRPCSPR